MSRWLPQPLEEAGRVDATEVVVYRQDRTEEGSWIELPNVRVKEIVEAIGTDARANLRYELRSGWVPEYAEHAQAYEKDLMTSPAEATLLASDDMIAVLARDRLGGLACLFVGMPVRTRFHLSGSAEWAVVHCEALSARARDQVITGIPCQDALDAEGDAAKALPYVLDWQWNPDGARNRCGGPEEDWPVDDAGRVYPVFIDAAVDEDYKTGLYGAEPSDWSLYDVARFLLYRYNGAEHFIDNPSPGALELVLTGRIPDDPLTFNPADPETYTAERIVPSGRPILGRDWSSLLKEIVETYGFIYRFETVAYTPEGPISNEGLAELTSTSDVAFRYALRIELPGLKTPKTLKLQAPSLAIDGQQAEVRRLEVDREHRSRRDWVAMGAPTIEEFDLILRPAWPAAAADGTTIAAIETFKRSHPDWETSGLQSHYRRWLFAEDGLTPLYDEGTATELTASPFTNHEDGPGRRVGPRQHLLGRDKIGRPVQHRLYVSTTFEHPEGVTGAYVLPDALAADMEGWQLVEGGYRLLSDRIGVEITAESPNDWDIGKSSESDAPYPMGTVRAVEAMSGKTGAVPFTLRLQVAFESDHRTKASATNSGDSLEPARRRLIDASSRFWSERRVKANTITDQRSDVVYEYERDDTDPLTAEMATLLTASGIERVEATAEIGLISNEYQLGDPIAGTAGRVISFDMEIARNRWQRNVYPVVLARSFLFEPEQRTILTIGPPPSVG